MTFFSASYSDARAKFKLAANRVGASVESVPVSQGLEVDIASLGEPDLPTLIVTSGLHGVEAFFGSAVQIATLASLHQAANENTAFGDCRLVLVHGLNPYGFAHIRRVDENNIDLNRNFPESEQQYQGAAAAYKALNGFLNPPSQPSRFEPYKLKAAATIVRYGLPALREAIACGQYQYPKGIFYGGIEPSTATRFVMSHCENWVGSASNVAHIDLHTGLGEFGRYKILVNEEPGADGLSWHAKTFGERSLGYLRNNDKTAYAVSGAMGVWLQNRFNDRRYHFAGAEFGTYDPVRIIGAIRAENRAHHYAVAGSKIHDRAKAELLECFCPANEAWREQTLMSAKKIITSAMHGLLKSSREATR